MRLGTVDTDSRLSRCPFCGTVAGFKHDQHGNYAATCANGSCAVVTPFHYRTQERAIEAWNRRDSHPAPEKCKPPYPFCLTPRLCDGMSQCPRDPCCAD